jgi:hypothetical protein
MLLLSILSQNLFLKLFLTNKLINSNKIFIYFFFMLAKQKITEIHRNVQKYTKKFTEIYRNQQNTKFALFFELQGFFNFFNFFLVCVNGRFLCRSCTALWVFRQSFWQRPNIFGSHRFTHTVQTEKRF